MMNYTLGGTIGPIALDATFDVGGERLQYPGDPSGSPGNTIQCRCATTYVVEGFEPTEEEIAAERAALEAMMAEAEGEL
jgi:hypothetical protein